MTNSKDDVTRYGDFDKKTKTKLQQRLKSLEYMCDDYLITACSAYPKIKNYVSVCYPNILLCVGRYGNDLVHYKSMHNIDTFLHRSKIISHTIKWVSLFPPFSVSINKKEFRALDDETQDILLNINYLFIRLIIIYFFEELPVISAPEKQKEIDVIVHDLTYILKTGQYETHSANLLFNNMMKNML